MSEAEAARTDDEAQEVLKQLMRLRVRILAYLRLIVRDFNLAEDAYQELALAFARRETPFEIRPEGMERWLFGAARKQALKTLRDRRREARVLDDDTLDALETVFVSERPGISHAQAEALQYCLKRLSAVNRLLLQLRYTEELDVPTIAERLRRKAGSIYVMLGRVHQFLRRCVKTRPIGEAGGDEV